MEFGGAQGDVFTLPLQAGTSGERAGPLLQRGGGEREGVRERGGTKRQKWREGEEREHK